MIYQLLMRVWEDCKADGAEKDDPELGSRLADEVQKHVVGIEEDIEAKKKELAEEIKEKNKKITSENIKDGFESAVRDSSYYLVAEIASKRMSSV
jgi:hypothetical protein